MRLKYLYILFFFLTLDSSIVYGDTWNINIKGYLSGFKVGIASGQFSLIDNKVFLKINAKTSGITKLFFPWKQTIIARSIIKNESITPEFYRVDDLRENIKKGHMEIIFNNKIASVNSSDPPVKNDTRRKQVDEELKIDVLDPANAIIAIGYLNIIYGNCNHVIPTFDGRRRFDLHIEEIGIEELKSSVFTDSYGESLKCKIKIKRIAGYSKKELKKHPTHGFVWFQTLPNSKKMMFPVKVQLPIGAGSFMAHLSINLVN